MAATLICPPIEVSAGAATAEAMLGQLSPETKVVAISTRPLAPVPPPQPSKKQSAGIVETRAIDDPGRRKDRASEKARPVAGAASTSHRFQKGARRDPVNRVAPKVDVAES